MAARLICGMAISLVSISVMKDQSRRLLGTPYRDFPRGVGIVDNDGMFGQVKFSQLWNLKRKKPCFALPSNQVFRKFISTVKAF